MYRPRLLLAVLGGFVLGLVAPHPRAGASGCDPKCDYNEVNLMDWEFSQYPQDGAVDVPTNTLLWGVYDQFDLIGPTGPIEVVPTDLGQAYEPMTELEPLTTYTLNWYSFGPESFTTGPGPDVTPPPVPTVLSWRSVTAASECPGNKNHYVDLEVDPGGSDSVAVFLERAGTIASRRESQTGTAPLTFRLGSGPCMTTWDEAKRGAETTVRFGAYDRAGNFSGWTEPEEVRIDGCRVAGSANSPLALALLALASLRRRRP